MPRFFFDTFDGENWLIDDNGIDCADREARTYAHAAPTGIAKVEMPNGDKLVLAVRVRDVLEHCSRPNSILKPARLDSRIRSRQGDRFGQWNCEVFQLY